MRTARWTTLLGGLLLLGSFAPGAAHDGHRSVTEDYVAPLGDAQGGFCRGGTITVNVNVVCFPVKGADTSAKITVSDDVNPAVGFAWQVVDVDGNCVGADPDDPLSECDWSGFACTSHTLGTLPQGGRELLIFLDGPATGALDCLDDVIGFATAGSATAVFH